MTTEPTASKPDDPIEPPKAPESRSGKKPTKRGPGRPKALTTSLRELIQQTGGLMVLAGLTNPRLAYDGQVLVANADKLAAELAAQADRSPKLKRALESLFTVSGWAGTIGVMAAVVVPIAANHGLLPAPTATMVGAKLPPPREPKEPTSESTKDDDETDRDSVPGGAGQSETFPPGDSGIAHPPAPGLALAWQAPDEAADA